MTHYAFHNYRENARSNYLTIHLKYQFFINVDMTDCPCQILSKGIEEMMMAKAGQTDLMLSYLQLY